MPRNERCHPAIACIVLVLLLSGTRASAAEMEPPPLTPSFPLAPSNQAPFHDVGFDQKLDARLPLDTIFRDERGRAIPLGSYFGKKPIVLTLAYFECPNLCTLTLTGLVAALRKIPRVLGRDYDVVTISIDPHEKPPLALAKKRSYLARYGRIPIGSDPARPWHFLTGDGDSIRRVARAVGFRYEYDRDSGQYFHASGAVIVTPHGKLSRYFLGIRFPPPELDEAIGRASRDEVGSLASAIFLYCFHYDPRANPLSRRILGVLRWAGGLSALGIALGIWALSRREATR